MDVSQKEGFDYFTCEVVHGVAGNRESDGRGGAAVKAWEFSTGQTPRLGQLMEICINAV